MIRVEQLSKTYSEVEALRSVSFSVPAGEVCGLLGPNGAGKSTTVKILAGALRPSAGRAFIADFDVMEEPLEVKKRIGYVPETGSLYSTLNAYEYLALVGALHDMEPADVAERSRRMFELFKIENAAARRLDTLSKGTRQKVVISAALLHDPEIILFDEPLSGLDANAAFLIKDLVRGLADRGKTVLYCSHILDVVERLCERVIIIDQGAIVADGNTKELLASSHRDTLETLFRSLTASEDDKELVGAFLGAIERADGHAQKAGRKRRR
ncbi:MAG: ABC transporter ATP-binding protein [Acidobacteriota bacterium]